MSLPLGTSPTPRAQDSKMSSGWIRSHWPLGWAPSLRAQPALSFLVALSDVPGLESKSQKGHFYAYLSSTHLSCPVRIPLYQATFTPSLRPPSASLLGLIQTLSPGLSRLRGRSATCRYQERSTGRAVRVTHWVPVGFCV